ncbi:MAG: CocE/NonD family hydrolase [Actinomycetota bacterium]
MKRPTVALLIAALALPLGLARAADHTTLIDVRLPMDDGVELAADVYVPTVPDADGDGLYPCVVELTPYRKETRAEEGAGYLPSQGIALIEVDARGTGGAAGEYDIVFSVREQQDAVAWIDWAATSATKDGQPLGGTNKLCETTVGMYGGSYSGIIQYLVASLPTQPGDVGFGRLPAGSPYLSTIAPQRAYGDLYRDIVYHGGMVIGTFGLIWSAGTTAYYTEPPTDLPSGSAISAWLDHLTKNDPMIVNYLERPYADAEFASDDSTPAWTQRIYEDSSALPRIGNLRVPTLHLAGLFDAFTRGQLETFSQALALEAGGGRGPNFLIAGPWNHTGTHFIDPDQGFKQRLGDWYRYWLEGKVNGAAPPSWISGPRATYFQMTSGTANAMEPSDGTWETSASWPPATAHVEKLFLAPQNLLARTLPPLCTDVCARSYVYEPAQGKAETWSRWDNAAGLPVPQQQLDQRLDSEGVTFETPVLASALSVAGPIAVHLVLGTQGAPGDPTLAAGWPGALNVIPPYHDTDIVVKISDVAPDGSARLVTQGYLRASHRAVDIARSRFIDGVNMAPYHPHTLAAFDPPPADGTPREYDIEIWPTAKTWEAGHRLRVDIYSADTPNHLALIKPALNTVYFDGSYLALPVTS